MNARAGPHATGPVNGIAACFLIIAIIRKDFIRLNAGALVKGNAMFVRLRDDFEWTPLTWPQDFLQLEALVGIATAGQRSLLEWLARAGCPYPLCGASFELRHTLTH